MPRLFNIEVFNETVTGDASAPVYYSIRELASAIGWIQDRLQEGIEEDPVAEAFQRWAEQCGSGGRMTAEHCDVWRSIINGCVPPGPHCVPLMEAQTACWTAVNTQALGQQPPGACLAAVEDQARRVLGQRGVYIVRASHDLARLREVYARRCARAGAAQANEGLADRARSNCMLDGLLGGTSVLVGFALAGAIAGQRWMGARGATVLVGLGALAGAAVTAALIFHCWYAVPAER